MATVEVLAKLFPGFMSDQVQGRWAALPKRFVFGQRLFGKVVHIEPFGAFVDVGVGFPALILVTNFREPAIGGRQFPNDYPRIGDAVDGHLYAFVDHPREVALTQQPLEKWMEEQWRIKWGDM